MRASALRRHDMTEHTWELLAAHLPAQYGDWKNTHRRFIRWPDKRIGQRLLEQWVADVDYEWLTIEASHIKVHPHAAGARGGNQDMQRTRYGERTKGGLNTKLHLAVDAHGMPIRVLLRAA